MRSALGCAALGLLLLLVAGTFDAEPLYVTGSALVLLGAGARPGSGRARGARPCSRELGARSVVEEEPLTMRIEARAGRLPLPPGWIDEPLLPEPVRFTRRPPARARARRGDLRAPRPPGAPAARARAARPARPRPARGRGGAPDEVLVLPRSFPVTATAGGEEATPAHARAALTAAAETEIDGLRPHREGAPASRIHWPALARGAGLMERKLISESDSRPLVVLDPRAPESPEALDAAVRAAASLAVHFAKRGGCGLLLPGDRRAHVIEPDLLAWPQAHVRLALLEDHTGPALTAAQNRRGLIVYVAARAVDRVAARARPHAGRLPARDPRRAARPPRRDRGRRLPGLRRRAHGQRGADGDRGGWSAT